MICLFAYCASEYHRLFPAVQGLLEDFLRKIEHTFFEQQDDRRAAEAEQTFLLAAADNACLTVVFDLADETCADLDLHNGTEIFGVQHAVFTSVLHKHGPFAHYYRLHGMIAPLNVPVAAFEAVVDIAIAVVILNAKPQYEAGAVYVIVCDIRTAYEILDVVIAVFYRNSESLLILYADMYPSQGEMSVSRSVFIGRAPALTCRVKKSLKQR